MYKQSYELAFSSVFCLGCVFSSNAKHSQQQEKSPPDICMDAYEMQTDHSFSSLLINQR
jgi:hypothetical protein